MHERGQAQRQVGAVGLQSHGVFHDRERVLVDVFVLCMLVDLEFEPAEFRDDELGQPGVDEQAQTCDRIGGEHELLELVADAFGGDAGQVTCHLGHGDDDFVGDPEAELRAEAGGTQHAKRVVGETLAGGRRGADDAVFEVSETVVQVGELVVRQ